MFSAIQLIGIYLSQHLGELLLGVVDVPKQLIVEVQDTGPVPISTSPVIHGDMGIQFLDDLGIDGPADGSCHPGPGVHFDGGDLYQGHHDQKQTAPASQKLLDVHNYISSCFDSDFGFLSNAEGRPR